MKNWKELQKSDEFYDKMVIGSVHVDANDDHDDPSGYSLYLVNDDEGPIILSDTWGDEYLDDPLDPIDDKDEALKTVQAREQELLEELARVRKFIELAQNAVGLQIITERNEDDDFDDDEEDFDDDDD